MNLLHKRGLDDSQSHTTLSAGVKFELAGNALYDVKQTIKSVNRV